MLKEPPLTEELIEAIQRADKTGVYIPELAERPFGVEMVLKALATSGDDIAEPRLE